MLSYTLVVYNSDFQPPSIHVESEGGEDDWVLTNYIEPADVGRPIERVQEKMESLGILPSSAHSVSSSVGSSDRPQGQPQLGDDSNEDSTQKRTYTCRSGTGGGGLLWVHTACTVCVCTSCWVQSAL